MSSSLRLDKVVQNYVSAKYGVVLSRNYISKLLNIGAVRYNGEVIKKKGFKFSDFTEASKIEVDDKKVKAVIEEYNTGQIADEYAKMWNESVPLEQFQLREEFIEKIDLDLTDIIFEDKDVVVMYKPAGILSHPSSKTAFEDSMIYRFLKYIKEVNGIMPRAGLVHRLDKETQGLLVFAKNMRAYNALKEQFDSNHIIKMYIVVFYIPPTPYGRATRLISRLQTVATSGHFWGLSSYSAKIIGGNDIKQVMGKDISEDMGAGGVVSSTKEWLYHPTSAIQLFNLSAKEWFDTIFKVAPIELNGYISLMRFKYKATFVLSKKELKKRIYKKIRDAKSYIHPLFRLKDKPIGVAAVQLITGRTHQIRAQFEYLGLPILGDKLYTPARWQKTIQTLGLWPYNNAIGLAAYGLSFYSVADPTKREYITMPIEKLSFRDVLTTA